MNEKDVEKVKEILDSKYNIAGIDSEKYHTQIARQIVAALRDEPCEAMRKQHEDWLKEQERWHDEPQVDSEGLISWERIRMVLQQQDKVNQHDNMFRLEAIALAQLSADNARWQRKVEELENPYAFQDGKCIPKYAHGYNGYENCRKDTLKALKSRRIGGGE